MTRDYAKELRDRAAWIAQLLKATGAKGIIYANSGGKDCTLVSILCREATDAVVGVCLPAGTARNYGEDLRDAQAAAQQFSIAQHVVDLGPALGAMVAEMNKAMQLSPAAQSNIAPRLRMATVYALGQTLGYLVAGTGNLSESTMGYFTKWGDGAYDFNPIADLTASEVFAFLDFLNAPENIRKKAPSAGLYEGQTDEADMGLTYASIDRYLTGGQGDPADVAKIERARATSAHKRRMPPCYPDALS